MKKKWGKPILAMIDVKFTKSGLQNQSEAQVLIANAADIEKMNNELIAGTLSQKIYDERYQIILSRGAVS